MYHLWLNRYIGQKDEIRTVEMLHQMIANKIPSALMTTGKSFILRLRNSPSTFWWKGSTYRVCPQNGLAGPTKTSLNTMPIINEAEARMKNKLLLTNW